MNKATHIVYLSQYGSSEAYAKKAAELLDIEAINLKSLKKNTLKHNANVLYFSSVRMSNLRGLKKLHKHLKNNPIQLNLFAITMSEIDDTETLDNLNNQIKDVFSRSDINLTLLPGNFNVNSMSFFHRRLFSFLGKVLSKQADPSEKDQNLLNMILEPKDRIDVSLLETIIKK